MKDRTILVIEDDDMNMKLVREILRVGKFKGIEAEDGKTGLQLARDHRPDLILMDIHLPDTDGYQLAREIHGHEELREIPIIAVTALAMPDDRKKAMEAGCVAYLSKPFHIPELLRTMGQYLDGSHPA